MMIETIGSLFSGGLGPVLGGVTGIIGAGIQKWFSYKEKKLEVEERAKDREHEFQVMTFEAKTAKDILTIEQAGQTDREDIKMRTASMASDTPLLSLKGIDDLSNTQKWLVVLADVFCRFIRPTSTIYFQLLTTALGVWAAAMLYKAGGGLQDGADPMQVMTQIVDMVLYLTCTSTTWWFGVRGMSRK